MFNERRRFQAKSGLTKRALDAGDSAAFSSIFPWPSPPGQAGFEFFLLPSIVHARPPVPRRGITQTVGLM